MILISGEIHSIVHLMIKDSFRKEVKIVVAAEMNQVAEMRKERYSMNMFQSRRIYFWRKTKKRSNRKEMIVEIREVLGRKERATISVHHHRTNLMEALEALLITNRRLKWEVQFILEILIIPAVENWNMSQLSNIKATEMKW